MRKNWWLAGISILFLCLCAIVVLFSPPVYSRLAGRFDEWSLRVRYALNPPEKVVFVPKEQAIATLMATAYPTATLAPAAATATITPPPATPTQTAGGLPTEAPDAPPLPEQVSLKSVRYEDQHGRWNYCAPANLSMALSAWGWDGNRDVVGPFLKPDDKDKNVMPYEMVSYVQENTNLKAIARVGGDLERLKRFLAAGFPVLVEKGVYLHDLTGVTSWMGHYQVLTGYDELQQHFITQDSFISADHEVTYEEMFKGWRAFNYTYIIIYPAEKEADVMTILGPDAEETTNAQNAALLASNEVYGLQGIDQYFAWFNRGTNLVALQDYAGAALAYDEAFKIYPNIPEAERPWRMMWYQTGPYWAYFYSGRYYDTLYLADGTLNAMQGDQNLEESYYWRAMARQALGDTQSAIQDFSSALQYHPGFEPAIYQLQLLGVQAP
jgi:tetratricopeptide (TPR) repeat protein